MIVLVTLLMALIKSNWSCELVNKTKLCGVRRIFTVALKGYFRVGEVRFGDCPAGLGY